MVLGIDVDGVIAQFTLAYGKLLTEIEGEDRLNKGWETDPAFPPIWDWEIPAGVSKQTISTTWKHIIASDHFWRDLRVIDGAGDAIRQLNYRAKEGNQVFYLTHRMGYNAK